MVLDPVRLRHEAESQAEQDFEFRDYLKRRTSLTAEDVDRLVFQISDRVWKTINRQS